MAYAESISKLHKFVRIVVRWCILSVIMGTVGGLLGAMFHELRIDPVPRANGD